MQFLTSLVVISLWLSSSYGAEFVVELNCTSVAECEQTLDRITMRLEDSFGDTFNTTLPIISFEDFDECAQRLRACVNNSRCINVFSTFECACLDGFEDTGSPSSIMNCTDVNECASLDYHNCSLPNEVCVNTYGSYECQCLINGVLVPQRCFDLFPETQSFPESQTTEIASTTLNTPTTDSTITTIPIDTKPETTATTSIIPTTESTSIISTIEATTMIPTTESTSIIPTSTIEATTMIPTTESTSIIPTTESTLIISTIEATSMIPTTESTSIIPTSTIEATTMIPTTESTSIIPTTESTLIISTIEATSMIPTTESTSMIQTTETSTTTTTTNPRTETSTTTSTVPITEIATTTSIVPTTTTETTTTISAIEKASATSDISSTEIITTTILSIPIISTTSAISTISTTTTATTSTIPITEATSTTVSSVVNNVLNRFNISNDDIEAGEVTNEEARNLISNLTQLIDENPVNEDQATAVVNIFSSFASSSVAFEQSVSSQITQLAENMLNSMILSGGAFDYRTQSISVAALDVTRNSSRVPFVSSFDNSLSGVRNPSILLPQSLYSPNQRLSFAGYRDAKLFQVSQITNILNSSFNFDQLDSGFIINSGVIGSSVNGSFVANLIDPVQVTLPTIIQQAPEVTQPNMTTIRRALYNPRCVFYDYSSNGESDNWSSEGCITGPVNARGEVSCQCNHLTSFAVLMSVESIVDDQVLTILSYVGCSVSIFGLVASILTYSMFRQLRKHKSKQILLHFCVALLAVYIVYVFGIVARTPSNQSQCIANGFFLHYFVAATFSWMLVEVLDMYLMFVKVWSEVSNPVKKAALFAWGFPFLLAIATLGAHFALERVYPGNQSQRLYPLYRATVVCWLSERGLYWAFFLPLGILLFVNLIFFFIVVYHVTCKRATSPLTRVHSNSRKIKARQHLFNAMAILLLTGPTWIIGFLINLDPVEDGPIRRILAYIFVILNAFQGLWIFIVFTIRPKAVRHAWRGLLCGKPKSIGFTKSASSSLKRPKTSSSYFSRLTKRKSSVDTRRFSATTSTDAFRRSKSKNPHKIETIDKTRENPKRYRYSNSPSKLDDSSSNTDSSGRKSSAESNSNLVVESQSAAVNFAFKSEEKSIQAT